MKIIKFSLFLMLCVILAAFAGCANPDNSESVQALPTEGHSVTEAAQEKDLARIDPYDADYQQGEAEALLKETLDGRDISELQGNEHFNAELLTFMISTDGYNLHDTSSFTAPNAEFFKIGESMSTDLNGDGKSERITVDFLKDAGTNNTRISMSQVSLDFYTLNPLDVYAVVDINIEDSYKEVLVCENGPSDDPATYVFTFDGSIIIDCCRELSSHNISGNIAPGQTGINIDGSGRVKFYQRASLLQTWFYLTEYSLDNSRRLCEIPPTDGYYKTDYTVFMVNPLSVFEKRDTASKSFIIPDGQTVTISGTDNAEWIELTAKDGKKGWAHLISFMEIQNGDTAVDASKVFYGLCYAD